MPNTLGGAGNLLAEEAAAHIRPLAGAERTRLAARHRTRPYWPGEVVLSRAREGLKTAYSSRWRALNPRLPGTPPGVGRR